MHWQLPLGVRWAHVQTPTFHTLPAAGRWRRSASSWTSWSPSWSTVYPSLSLFFSLHGSPWCFYYWASLRSEFRGLLGQTIVRTCTRLEPCAVVYLVFHCNDNSWLFYILILRICIFSLVIPLFGLNYHRKVWLSPTELPRGNYLRNPLLISIHNAFIFVHFHPTDRSATSMPSLVWLCNENSSKLFFRLPFSNIICTIAKWFYHGHRHQNIIRQILFVSGTNVMFCFGT